MVDAGKTDILQIILALCAATSFPGSLNGWQQERDQDANDGDNDQ
jgi:hypothetical protein